MVIKNILCVILYCVSRDGLAFKLFDAEPLIGASKPVVLKGVELENVINLDPGGEYTTLNTLFQNQQNIQNSGFYDIAQERCMADHMRCVTSITTNDNTVCVAINKKFKELNSICDLYLLICNYDTNATATDERLDFEVANFGPCTHDRAKEVFVYDPHFVNQTDQ